MSAAAINRQAGTRPSISMRPGIRSSKPMIRPKDGVGVTSTKSCSIFRIGRRRIWVRYPDITEVKSDGAKERSMRRLGRICVTIAIVAGSPAFAQAGRYELVPEPDVRQTSTNRVASAYVIDKKANQFWICTARYNFQDLTANNGDCVKLPSDIGRPSLTEAYDMRAVTGSAAISVFLPVFWFIEPTSGEVQFCAVRHAGLCVQMNLP